MAAVGKYCSNCGAGLIGAGRYCAACGAANDEGDATRHALKPSPKRPNRNIKIGAIVAVLVAALLLGGSVALALGSPPKATVRAASVPPTVAATATTVATVTPPPTAAPVVVVVATPTPDIAIRDYLARQATVIVETEPYVMAIARVCNGPSPACQAAYDKNWPLFTAAVQRTPTGAVPVKCVDLERKYKDYFSATTSYLGLISIAVSRTSDTYTFLSATNPALEKSSKAFGDYSTELKSGACHP